MAKQNKVIKVSQEFELAKEKSESRQRPSTIELAVAYSIENKPNVMKVNHYPIESRF